MKTKALIILPLLLMVLIPGCKKSGNEASVREAEKLVDNQNATVAVPDFLQGYFDNGTYENPPRISNPNRFDMIELTSENRLDFPELSVLAVVPHRWGLNPYLLEQDDEKIIQIFDYLKDTEITSQITKLEFNALGSKIEADQDAELSLVVLTADAKYALVTVSSFKDDTLHIRITQENSEEEMFLTAYSEPLHDYLRELFDLQKGDPLVLQNAENIKYLTKDERWVELSKEKLEDWRRLTEDMEQIKNYSSGCPFELKLIVEARGETSNVSAATDGCGVIIIGDQTYQLKKEKRKELQTLFDEAPWHL